MIESLAQRELVLCLGSGGVGKTTTSAALALALAHQGRRVVVLTIDPARRLADTLGLAPMQGLDVHKVLGQGDVLGRSDGVPGRGDEAPPLEGPLKGEVWATMLDPAATLRHVVEQEAPSAEKAERILANPLFDNLAGRLSGTNEYMATERLHQLHLDPRFDVVVVDTPPSNHAFDFLDSPSRLTGFLDHRLYRSVLGARRGVLRPLNLWAEGMIRLLGRLVGGDLVTDVVDLFGDLADIDQGFRARAAAIDALLTGEPTGYVLVAAPQSDRLAEASWILDRLHQRGRSTDLVVLNRCFPRRLRSAIDAAEFAAQGATDRRPTAAEKAFEENQSQLAWLANREGSVVADLTDQASGAPVIQLDELTDTVAGLRSLAELAASLTARGQ